MATDKMDQAGHEQERDMKQCVIRLVVLVDDYDDDDDKDDGQQTHTHILYIYPHEYT